MIKVEIKLDDAQLKARLARQQADLARLPKDALVQFVSLTPVRTGNARSRTYLTNNNQTIRGDYPYAQRLDTGWSKQAPAGMTGPFATWFKQELKRIIGK